MRRPKQIIDDRDRYFPAFKLPATRRGQLRYFTADEIQRIADKHSTVTAGTRQLQHFATAIFGVCVVFCIVRVVGRPSLLAVGMAVMYTGMAAMFFRLARRKHIPSLPRHEFSSLLLDESHCPSCAYRLEPERTESDGLTVCSECGAAWKPPRSQAPPDVVEPIQPPATAPQITHDWFPFATATANRTIADAKGHRVPLFPITRHHRRPTAMTEARLRSVQSAATSIAMPYVFVGLFLFAGGLRLLFDPAGPFAGSPISALIPALTLAYFLSAVYYCAGHYRDARSARAMLKFGHCPSCSAPLNLGSTDPEGHHVCGTCAASWHPADRTRLKLRPRLFVSRPPVVTGDHRGVMHPIFDAEVFRPPGDIPQFLTKEAWRDLRREFLASDWYAAVNRIVSVALLICVATILIGDIRRQQPPSITTCLIFVASFLWTLRACRGLGNDPRRLIDSLVKRHRCGCCGNDLRSLEPADDGCTRCPECGAAWRLGHLRQPASSGGAQ